MGLVADHFVTQIPFGTVCVSVMPITYFKAPSTSTYCAIWPRSRVFRHEAEFHIDIVAVF